MTPNHYRFETRWRVSAPREEVFAVLTNSKNLTRWWPSVYRRVDQISPPRGNDGVGKRIHVRTQGWLPYRLSWGLNVVEYVPPSRLAFEASGDFVGTGVWTFQEDGASTVVDYVWDVRADKTLLRYLSPLLKPVFSLNHRWAMERGLESLEIELERRRGKVVPPPPGPVSAMWSGSILGGVLLAIVLVLMRLFG